MALTDKLTAIADAIRDKTGGTEALTLDQMPTEIAGIETGGGETFPQKLFETDILLEETITAGQDATVCTISTGLNDTSYRANTEVLLVAITCTPTDTSYAYHSEMKQFFGCYQGSYSAPCNMFSIMNTDGTSGLYDTYISNEGLRLSKISNNLGTLTVVGKRGSGYPVAGTYHLALYRTGVTH